MAARESAGVERRAEAGATCKHLPNIRIRTIDWRYEKMRMCRADRTEASIQALYRKERSSSTQDLICSHGRRIQPFPPCLGARGCLSL